MADNVTDSLNGYLNGTKEPIYYDKYLLLKAKEGVDDEYTKYAKQRTKELKDYLSQI